MKLAIFSGKPAFKQPQHVGYPRVEAETRRRFHQYMDQAFDLNYLTNDGPLVRRLEKEIAEIHGVKHCAAVCNGTIALLLALKGLELGGEVIMPAFTFVATSHACLWQNITPVFCDISPDTLMIDPQQAEALITPRTTAVIGVHLFGNICDVEALLDICDRRGLLLIFDAAHAFNCSLDGTMVGRFGHVELLSFHATKFFSTFEGGAILTEDDRLDHRVRLLRNFGFRTYDDVGFLGINGKMSEASAAMGLASLPAVRERLAEAAEVNRKYDLRLSQIPGLTFQRIRGNVRTNYHYAVIRIDEEDFGVSRDMLHHILWQENVMSRRYFFPGCHEFEPYRSMPEINCRLPVTDQIAREVLCLPTNLSGGMPDVERIVEIIETVHQQAERIRVWAQMNLQT